MSDTTVKNNNNSHSLAPKGESPRVVTSSAMAAQRRVTYSPHVDILELADGLVLTLDMPGVKADDVEVHFERGELIVKGTRQTAQRRGQCLVEELVVGDYYRAFLISQDVAADRITAELKNGVLTIQLPKATAAQPRRVQVKGS